MRTHRNRGRCRTRDPPRIRGTCGRSRACRARNENGNPNPNRCRSRHRWSRRHRRLGRPGRNRSDHSYRRDRRPARPGRPDERRSVEGADRGRGRGGRGHPGVGVERRLPAPGRGVVVLPPVLVPCRCHLRGLSGARSLPGRRARTREGTAQVSPRRCHRRPDRTSALRPGTSVGPVAAGAARRSRGAAHAGRSAPGAARTVRDPGGLPKASAPAGARRRGLPSRQRAKRRPLPPHRLHPWPQRSRPRQRPPAGPGRDTQWSAPEVIPRSPPPEYLMSAPSAGRPPEEPASDGPRHRRSRAARPVGRMAALLRLLGSRGRAPRQRTVPRHDFSPDLDGCRQELARWQRHADSFERELTRVSFERAHLLAWLAALHPSSAVVTPAVGVGPDGTHLLRLVAGGRQLSWRLPPGTSRCSGMSRTRSAPRATCDGTAPPPWSRRPTSALTPACWPSRGVCSRPPPRCGRRRVPPSTDRARRASSNHPAKLRSAGSGGTSAGPTALPCGEISSRGALSRPRRAVAARTTRRPAPVPLQPARELQQQLGVLRPPHPARPHPRLHRPEQRPAAQPVLVQLQRLREPLHPAPGRRRPGR